MPFVVPQVDQRDNIIHALPRYGELLLLRQLKRRAMSFYRYNEAEGGLYFCKLRTQ